MNLKKILRSSLSAAMAVLIASSGAALGELKNADAADLSVFSFNYGSGIEWSADDPLPNFKTPAAKLDLINISQMSEPMKYAMISLQGIVNREQPQIIISNGDGTRDSWIDDLVGRKNVTETSDFFAMINKYRSYLKGLVVYNDAEGYEDSINVALSVAGAEDCLVTSSHYVSSFSDSYYIKNPLAVKVNLYGKFAPNTVQAYTWLYNNYYKTGKLNKRMLIGLSPKAHTTHFGDYAVATKSAIMWLEPSDPYHKRVLDLFYNQATPGVTYNMGWWPNEDSGIVYATSKGVSTVPADFFENATVYSGQSKALTLPKIPAKPELENKMYVALGVADGDNTQYNQGTMKSHWSRRRRYSKDVPISWTVSPALYYVAPQMFNYYSNNTTGSDMLICGPSGLGYTKTTRWRQKSGFLNQYMRYTNGVFEKTGLNIITMWDRISEPTYAQFANGMPSLLGSTINNNWFNDADITNPDSMFNYTYKYYPAETGVAYKNYLPLYGLGIKSGYLRSVDDAKSDIMGKMANYYESAPRFLYKQFVPWDVGPGDIINMAQELKELYGDKIEFVRADHFFMLLNEANGMPYNLALRSDKATASSAAALAANAADGSISTGWTAAGGAGEYYQIDLGERCELYKYTLKNAGAAGMSETLNTKAYRLQYSLNGNDWATADTVTGNTKSIIYKTLPNTVAARYVKIVIDDPGADSKARIQDIEIHGTKLGITDDSAPVSVTRIALSGVTKTTLNTGDSLTLSKKVSPANVSNGAVTFKSSSSSALSVTQNGFVKAGKVTKPTAVKITADANDGSGKTASVLFTVRTGKVESVSLSKKKVTLNAGKKFALNAVASPSTARNKALGFKTTAKKVAAVSSKGVITAKGAGVAKITAFAKDGSGKKAVITVTVKPAAPTKVKVTRTQSEAKVSCKKVAGAKKYEFYAKKKGGGWKKAAVVSKNSCAVKGLSKKAKYSFRVRAVGKAGSKKLYGKYSKATKLK